MALNFKSLLVLTLINLLCQIVGAKVFMVLMEDDPVITYTASLNSKMNGDEVENYKQKVINRHDIFLESLLPSGSYTKLYSYTHLLNGFAIHTSSERAMDSLQDAKGVRVIQEDIKLMKMTTHTPDYLGLPSGVWPVLGGADYSGEGVVIGMIDTGINPDHPSFSNSRPWSNRNVSRFRGRCEAGNGFSANACNGKIVGAQHFARAAIAAGDFNSTHDYASAFDADGHGSHTASTAAGNYRVAVLANGYNYGYASGMAPGAHIAVYKAVFSFGGYMSDVVAAVDKAVEDGVDILNLSIGPSSVPPGPASFLNILEMELLFATKAGVLVVQAVGNGGPSPSSILSFSPWIMSVAASTIDRKYNNSVLLGSGKSLSGTGLSPPTSENQSYPLAAAEDVCIKNASFMSVQNCQEPNPFIPSLARNKIIICSYSNDFAYMPKIIDSIANTIKVIGAVGFIFTMDRGVNAPIGEISLALSLPGIVINTKDDAQALWDYYDSGTIRGMNGGVVRYGATARINDGRNAIYTGRGPMVASYSSRGPDVNNVLMQTADVLKPNILAPGNSIWAAWSPEGTNDQYTDGQDFAMMSGTSMATPHVSGIAAMIKQRHPTWSPAAIASAIMTSANTADSNGVPTLAQHTSTSDAVPATPFDYGAGTINPTRAIDPGLIFDIQYNHFVQFLCTVPGVDDESVRRAVGSGCPSSRIEWGSDLNTASVTVANLVGSRRVYRRVTSVGLEREKYSARVRLPLGVGVTVTPDSFTINPNGTRAIRIDLVAKDLTNMYTFGEIAFHGDRDHVVRIPLTVFISSTLSD